MKERLLLAEDEAQLADAVATLLRYGGYEVDVARDGAEALERAAQARYDGMILDIMMPRLDGLSALRQLRARGDATPVLLLTAKNEVDDRVAGLDSGANDYLGKPFAIRELLARIRSMTRSQEERTPREVRFAACRANREELTLEGPGGCVSLSNREFALLELLVQAPDKPLTRAFALEKLWPGEADGGAVELHMAFLRSKLGAVRSGAVLAQTAPGEWRLETAGQPETGGEKAFASHGRM
jgi:DNA-binding response OmpR family regulator